MSRFPCIDESVYTSNYPNSDCHACLKLAVWQGGSGCESGKARSTVLTKKMPLELPKNWFLLGDEVLSEPISIGRTADVDGDGDD